MTEGRGCNVNEVREDLGLSDILSSFLTHSLAEASQRNKYSISSKSNNFQAFTEAPEYLHGQPMNSIKLSS